MLANFNMIEGLIWAVCVNAPAVIVSLSVLLFAKFGYVSVFAAAFMAGAIRLLLTLIGTAIIICYVHVAVLSFVFWVFIFYSVMLLCEIYIAVRIFNEKGRGLTVVNIS